MKVETEKQEIEILEDEITIKNKKSLTIKDLEQSIISYLTNKDKALYTDNDVEIFKIIYSEN